MTEIPDLKAFNADIVNEFRATAARSAARSRAATYCF